MTDRRLEHNLCWIERNERRSLEKKKMHEQTQKYIKSQTPWYFRLKMSQFELNLKSNVL